jgi:hypothetical protein
VEGITSKNQKSNDNINMYIYIVIIVILFLILRNGVFSRRDTIFTCTTFFDYAKRDSWKMFCDGIDHILMLHDPTVLARIDRWVVVNEYSDTPREDWSERMASRYPFMIFIQKSMEEKGQPKSCQMVFGHIKPYTYWIHWEETWLPTRPFLMDAFRIMEQTNISQLQFTKNETGYTDWMKRTSEPKRCVGTGASRYCIVEHTAALDANVNRKTFVNTEEMVAFWPLYSLRPSINRVSFYNFGNFSLQTFPPPIMSEYDFAQRWYRAGGVKGIFYDGPVSRAKAYVSTHYHMHD